MKSRSRRVFAYVVAASALGGAGCGLTADRTAPGSGGGDASGTGGHSSGAGGKPGAAGGAGSPEPPGNGGLGGSRNVHGGTNDAGDATASGDTRDASLDARPIEPREAASLEGGGGDFRCSSDAGTVEVSTQVVVSTNDQDVGNVVYYAALGTAAGPGANVFALTVGPDGNVWFTTSGTVTPVGAPNPKDDTSCESNFVGRMTPEGIVTRFWLPRRNGKTLSPAFIAAGPDGNLWLTVSGDEILRMSTSGALTAFAVPSLGGVPLQIVSGSDGNLWFAEQASEKIGRITPSGVVTEFFAGPPIDARGVDPLSNLVVVHRAITAGPGGTIRYTVPILGDALEWMGIGELTSDGGGSNAIAITASPPDGVPASLASDLAGDVWFNVFSAPMVGRLDRSGGIREFLGACLKDGGQIGYTDERALVASSPAGGIWFTHPEGAGIDRRDEAGVTNCYVANGPAGSFPGLSFASRLAPGKNGELWFAETVVTPVPVRKFEERALYIGRLTP